MKLRPLIFLFLFCALGHLGCSKSEDSPAAPTDVAIGTKPDGQPVQTISQELRTEFEEFAQDFAMILDSSKELRQQKSYVTPSAFSQSLKNQSCTWTDLPDHQGFAVSGAQCPLSYKSSFVTEKLSEEKKYLFETHLKVQSSLSHWTSVISIELQGQGSIKEAPLMTAELKSQGIIQTRKRKWHLSQFSKTKGINESSEIKSINSLFLNSEAGEILFQVSQELSQGQLKNAYYLNGQILTEEAGSLLADQLVSLFFIHRQ